MLEEETFFRCFTVSFLRVYRGATATPLLRLLLSLCLARTVLLRLLHL